MRSPVPREARFTLFTFTHWRRKQQPTPIFLPGKCHGQRSLAGPKPHPHDSTLGEREAPPTPQPPQDPSPLRGTLGSSLRSPATLISWCPLSGLKGVQPPLPFGERTRDGSPGLPFPSPMHESITARGTTRISGSLSCGAREVRSPCAWRGGARPGSRVTGGD